jgi:hypothetical protein
MTAGIDAAPGVNTAYGEFLNRPNGTVPGVLAEL